MSKADRPWGKWYWADWRSDPGLRMCGFAARGIWMDLLSLMAEAEPFGHLLVNGKPPTSQQLATMLGGTARQVEALLAELDAAGVPSRTAEGVLFSRRMVRDREKDNLDRKNGRCGGNPRLRRKDNGGVNPPDKAQKPEARSQKPENQEVEATQAPPPQPRRRGTRLPDDWEPGPDDLAFAERHGWEGAALDTEALKFRNYWTAKSGAAAAKLDWHRTWCNWLLTARRPGQAPPEASSKAQSAAALIARIQ